MILPLKMGLFDVYTHYKVISIGKIDIFEIIKETNYV